ncbi:MAG: hypothetical protein AB7P03_22380 [Kofleriaceae bacterium]
MRSRSCDDILRTVTSREDWQRRLGPLYGGAVALVRSTPWRWPTEVGRDDARSSGWVIAIGLPIGFAAWLVAVIISAIGISQSIAALFGLAVLTIASAAIVERGVAERIDDWQGQLRSPGVASVLALVFVTLVRAAAILAVPRSQWLWVFLAVAVIGRWAGVFLQALGDPISDDGSRRSLVATPTPAWLTAAITLVIAIFAILAIGKLGVVVIAITAAAAFGLGLEAQKRDAGLSPSVVAMAAAIGELAALLFATVGH